MPEDHGISEEGADALFFQPSLLFFERDPIGSLLKRGSLPCDRRSRNAA